jgi:hypothetical protein
MHRHRYRPRPSSLGPIGTVLATRTRRMRTLKVTMYTHIYFELIIITMEYSPL